MTSLTRTYPAIAQRPLRLRSLIALHRSRRALARLDTAALSDVGLTEAEAQSEARRAFWDIPCTWRGARG
jgi:uncharacterized protein YjiS (DUF1127 family)